MQTFLPENNLTSVNLLDNKRLGKQRVETLQILNTLMGYSEGWANHPAVRMWRGYEVFLCEYGFLTCKEWVKRGFVDSCESKILQLHDILIYVRKATPQLPPWFADNRVFESHRSNLLRKDGEFYARYNWKEPNSLPYFWPV